MTYSKQTIDFLEDVIGLNYHLCFMCGTDKDVTRHHIIPHALKPHKNITIPLCREHHDVTHPTVQQFKVPLQYRKQLSKAIKNINDGLGRLKSLKVIHKNKKSTNILISNHSTRN